MGICHIHYLEYLIYVGGAELPESDLADPFAGTRYFMLNLFTGKVAHHANHVFNLIFDTDLQPWSWTRLPTCNNRLVQRHSRDRKCVGVLAIGTVSSAYRALIHYRISGAFKRAWAQVDPDQTGYIPQTKFSALLTVRIWRVCSDHFLTVPYLQAGPPRTVLPATLQGRFGPSSSD
jgi:hypothetical protein